MIRIALALALAAGTAAADPMTLARDAAGAACAAEGGVLELAEGAAVMVDLSGNGMADDALVWEYGGFCGPDLGFRGGSGGAMLHVAVGDVVQSFPAGSWVVQTVTFPTDSEPSPPLQVLLLAQHGSECDGAGAAPCVQAVVWSEGERRFMTPVPYLGDPEDE